MSLETAQNVIKANMDTGRNFKEAFDDCVDMGLCSLEDEVQLRALFVPSVAEVSVPPSEVLVNTPLPQPGLQELTNPATPRERSAPVLHIDWGTEVRPDVILSPIFTIQGSSLRQQPLVYFPIDSRIVQNGWSWNESPITQRTPNGWRFDQELQLEKVGQYRFHVVVIDPEPGFSDPGYYRSSFRMDVVDPKVAGQRRKITIQAEGNFLGNFDRFGKDADIEIVGGGNVTLNARDESLVDKLAETNKTTSPASISDWTTTIPFECVDDSAKRVPYVSQPDVLKPVNHLNMMESSGKKCYILTGGRRLHFGRDVPEQDIRNDVPLAILPGTSEEKDRADEFVALNGLFSREHAHLEVSQDGVFLVDVRKGGIQNATILDEQALGKGFGALMFSHDGVSTSPRSVLFSKMLAMQFTPRHDNFWDMTLKKNLPEKFPLETLSELYSLESATGVSSICITPEKYFKQKNHIETLLQILQKVPQIAESEWWARWFKKPNNADPRHGTYEYWFVPLFVTLGRDRHSAIRLESRQWRDVRFRILWINNSLYIENISHDTAVEFGVDGKCCPLLSFRPVPLCSGCFVQKGNAVLRFE